MAAKDKAKEAAEGVRAAARALDVSGLKKQVTKAVRSKKKSGGKTAAGEKKKAKRTAPPKAKGKKAKRTAPAGARKVARSYYSKPKAKRTRKGPIQDAEIAGRKRLGGGSTALAKRPVSNMTRHEKKSKALAKRGSGGGTKS